MQDRLTWIGASFLVVVFIGVAAYMTAARAVIGTDPKVNARNEAVALEPPPVGSPQPKAVVPGGTEYEFGYMQQGTEQSHVFVIRNEGQAPLKLVQGPTSCQCTISNLAQNEVPPGGSADVQLKWEPKGEFPMFAQTATIYTNDRDKSVISLRVTGVVAKVLNLSPTEVTISKVPAEESRDGYVVLYSTVVANFEINSVELTDKATEKFFDVKVVTAGDATLKSFTGKCGYEVTVTVKPGLPLGHFRQRLKIQHSIPNVDPIEVPIFGTIVGDVSIKGGDGIWNEEAGVLVLGRVLQRQGLKQSLKLYVKDAPEDFSITEVVAKPDDALRVECSKPKRVGKMSMVDVKIEVPLGTRPQLHLGGSVDPMGEIVIRTNHPKTPEVKMLVKFEVIDQ